MAGILEGVRVVDLTRYIAGPYCGVLLADMGAEVIKVERPGRGEVSRIVAPWKDGVSLFFPPYNRNKKSVAADLRTPEGLEIAKRLIAKSDVIIENFRAGTMEKMGLSYEEVKKINPGIIMVSVTGFGQTGPLRDRLAFDGIISAMSGVTRLEKGNVQRSKGPIHDYMAAMYGAFGTVLALYDRMKTGKGQRIDVSMLSSSAMIRTIALAEAHFDGAQAEDKDESAPYGYLKAKDGWINYHAGTNAFYNNLLTIIDSPFLHQEKFIGSIPNRLAEADELVAEIQKWADDKTCDELEELFTNAGIPSGIVATPTRLLNNEHLRANGYIIEQPVRGLEEPVPFMGFPFKMSEHEDLEYRAAPAVGEHTDQICRDVLGMDEAELADLKARGILA